MKRVYGWAFVVCWLAVFIGAAAVERAARAQTPTPTPAGATRTLITTEGGTAPVIPSMFEPIITGGLLDGILVRNKPLSAILDSRSVRTPTLGATTTTITRRVITRTFRDSQGRVRREQTVYLNNQTPATTDPAQTITIFDPIALKGYSLDPATHIATRYKLPTTLSVTAPIANQTPLLIRILRGDTPNAPATSYTLAPPQIQSLGTQLVAGILAAGWRTAITVPAGALGNQQAATTTYEAWFSTDLQMLVKCSITSPLGGEQTLALTSISQAEPAAALFQVPANYTIREMGVVRTDLAPPR